MAKAFLGSHWILYRLSPVRSGVMAQRIGRMGTAFGVVSEAAAFIGQMSAPWIEVTFSTGSATDHRSLATRFAPRTVKWGPGNPGMAVIDHALDTLTDIILTHGDPIKGLAVNAAFHCEVSGAARSSVFSFEGLQAEMDGAVDLVFGDGSAVTVHAEPFGGRPTDADEPPTDDASSRPQEEESQSQRWAQPLEVAEFRSLEPLIGHLQGILDGSDADEYTRIRVQGAIEVLRGTHRAVKIGETTRGEVFSVVKWVAAFAAWQLPSGIVAWSEALRVLQGLDPAIVEYVRSIVSG